MILRVPPCSAQRGSASHRSSSGQTATRAQEKTAFVDVGLQSATRVAAQHGASNFSALRGVFPFAVFFFLPCGGFLALSERCKGLAHVWKCVRLQRAGREMLRQARGPKRGKKGFERRPERCRSSVLRDESRAAVSRTRACRLFFLSRLTFSRRSQVVHRVVAAVWSRCGAHSGRTQVRV